MFREILILNIISKINYYQMTLNVSYLTPSGKHQSKSKSENRDFEIQLLSPYKCLSGQANLVTTIRITLRDVRFGRVLDVTNCT